MPVYGLLNPNNAKDATGSLFDARPPTPGLLSPPPPQSADAALAVRTGIWVESLTPGTAILWKRSVIMAGSFRTKGDTVQEQTAT